MARSERRLDVSAPRMLRWMPGLARALGNNRYGRAAFVLSALSALTLSAAPSTRTAAIGNQGKLSGPLNGYAWVAASEQAAVTSPQPCNRDGCFKNTDGRLCTSGHIQALACTGQGTPQFKCNWDKNWGVILGMNTADPAGPWGSAAPTGISVRFSSASERGTSGHFRLTVHVAGDPYSKQYCVDNYTSGAVVRPSDLTSQCWFQDGDRLPNFQDVDTIGLLRVSEHLPVNFNFCVDGVTAY